MLGEGHKVTVMSRDEAKQQDMESWLGDPGNLRLRLGDVRDCQRLQEIMWPGTFDAVIHAAALKRIDRVAYDPIEAYKTNIQGTVNVCQAALKAGIAKVMVVSSDKAVDPSTLYGVTKLASEYLAIHCNSYSPTHGTKISAVRYGNVWGSRGSVALVWDEQIRKEEPLFITDPSMTRFIITMPEAVEFVLSSLERMEGGETYIPLLKAATIDTLFQAVADGHPFTVSGLRPGGEKMHERMMSYVETTRALFDKDRYLIPPAHQSWRTKGWPGTKIDPFDYTSEGGPWLSVRDIRSMPLCS